MRVPATYGESGGGGENRGRGRKGEGVGSMSKTEGGDTWCRQLVPDAMPFLSLPFLSLEWHQLKTGSGPKRLTGDQEADGEVREHNVPSTTKACSTAHFDTAARCSTGRETHRLGLLSAAAYTTRDGSSVPVVAAWPTTEEWKSE